jgi:hypothetical protein
MERLVKRKEGLAAEYARFSSNLVSITETSEEVFALDTNDVPLLNEGIGATAKHISTSRALLEDEGRAWDEGVLEDFKGVRDGLVSLREMFERWERGARDTIPACEKRILANEGRLAGVRAKGDAAKPGEAEKIENAIVNVSLPFHSLVLFSLSWPPLIRGIRTNSPSRPNMHAASLSRNACAMRFVFSTRGLGGSGGCIRSGRARG